VSLDPTGCWAHRQKPSYMQETLKAYNTNKIVSDKLYRYNNFSLDLACARHLKGKRPVCFFYKATSNEGQLAGNQIYFYNIE